MFPFLTGRRIHIISFISIRISLLSVNLSLLSHPTYNGLLGLYNQNRKDNEYSMYLSCNFLACLCRLFMKHMNIEEDTITKDFTHRQYGMYKFLSNKRPL